MRLILRFCSKKNSRFSIGILMLVSILFLGNIFFITLHRAFKSDDVSNILLIMTKPLKDYYWMPPDTFVSKIPFFLVSSFIFAFTRVNLIVLVIFNAFFLIVCYGVFYLRIIHTNKSHYAISMILPMFYLATLSYPFLYSLSFAMLRSIEIGFVFLFLIKFMTDVENKFSKGLLNKRMAFFLLANCIIVYSDPYFLFTIYVPLALFTALIVLLAIIRKKKDIVLNYTKLLIELVFICMGYYILKLFLNAQGFYSFFESIKIIRLSEVPDRIRIIVLSVLDFFNANVIHVLDPLSFLGRLSNFILLSISVIGFIFYLGYNKSRRKNYLFLFFLLSPLYIIIINLISGYYYVSDDNFHYLILAPFFLTITISYLLQRLRNSILSVVITALMLFAMIMNISQLYSSVYHHTETNRSNYNLIAFLWKQRLFYGYAEYWNSAINTYLSQNTIKIRQVVCAGGRMTPYQWLSKKSWYNPSTYTGNTFILFDRNNPLFIDCTMKKLTQQFGSPDKIIPYDSTITLLVWDYNIASKFEKNY